MGKFFSYIVRKKWTIIYLVLLLCLSLTLAIVQPDDAGPDESMKMDICKFISDHGYLPHGGDESIRDELWGNSYGFTPITSYVIGAGFISIARNFTNDIHVYYICARFVSVIFYILMAIFVIKIGEKLFKNKYYKWIFIMLVTLLPEVIFLGSYINCDTLALFSIALIIYAWLEGIETKWNWKSCIILAVGIGLCAIAYYNAYGFILTSVILYVAYAIINKIGLKEFLKKGAIISAIVLTICGWWFVRNAVLYNGDIIGLKTSEDYGEQYAIDYLKPSNIETPQRQGMSLINMLFTEKWAQLTLKSFIALFGIMNLVPPFYIYHFFLAIFAGGIIGYIAKYFSLKNLKEFIKDKNKLVLEILFGINIIIPIALSISSSFFSDFEPQGRYIMPMLIPFMYFITKGIQNILDKIIKNEKVRKVLQIILMTALVLIAIFTVYYIIKVYIAHGFDIFLNQN